MEPVKQYLIPYLISNLVFGLCIAGAIRRPMWTRIFLAAFFLLAFYFNSTTAIKSPEIYLTYASLSALSFYGQFINGFFSTHITTFVLIIAAGQFLIFLGLVLNKNWANVACIGGIIFGLAIAPLGVGSAFPATVSMAVAFYLLLKKYKHDFIWKWKQYENPLTE
ncbi:MAG: hypothetical protein C0490_15185 [Marivirga sp.]|nr:hypothetical protein [Marivirga sp.]